MLHFRANRPDLQKKLDLAFGTVNGWYNNQKQPYLPELVKAAELCRSSTGGSNCGWHKNRKRPNA